MVRMLLQAVMATARSLEEVLMERKRRNATVWCESAEYISTLDLEGVTLQEDRICTQWLLSWMVNWLALLMRSNV